MRVLITTKTWHRLCHGNDLNLFHTRFPWWSSYAFLSFTLRFRVPGARLTPFEGGYSDLEKCANFADANRRQRCDWTSLGGTLVFVGVLALGVCVCVCVIKDEPDWRWTKWILRFSIYSINLHTDNHFFVEEDERKRHNYLSQYFAHGSDCGVDALALLLTKKSINANRNRRETEDHLLAQ